MLPETAVRVPEHTADHVNQKIRSEMIDSIRYYASVSPETMDRRINELDGEWDIERTLEANAATLALVGTALGALFSRKWLILPAFVTGFLLQHALQGWCPPVPVFRRKGFRTSYEIDKERYALKAVRGDFRDAAGDVDRAMAAVGI